MFFKSPPVAKRNLDLPNKIIVSQLRLACWFHTDQNQTNKKTGIFFHSAWERKARSRWRSPSHRIQGIKEALSCLENCKNWVKEECVCLCVFDMKCTWTPWLYLSALQRQRVAARCWRPSHQDLFVSSHIYRVENESRTPDIHHINAVW